MTSVEDKTVFNEIKKHFCTKSIVGYHQIKNALEAVAEFNQKDILGAAYRLRDLLQVRMQKCSKYELKNPTKEVTQAADIWFSACKAIHQFIHLVRERDNHSPAITDNNPIKIEPKAFKVNGLIPSVYSIIGFVFIMLALSIAPSTIYAGGIWIALGIINRLYTPIEVAEDALILRGAPLRSKAYIDYQTITFIAPAKHGILIALSKRADFHYLKLAVLSKEDQKTIFALFHEITRKNAITSMAAALTKT